MSRLFKISKIVIMLSQGLNHTMFLPTFKLVWIGIKARQFFQQQWVIRITMHCKYKSLNNYNPYIRKHLTLNLLMNDRISILRTVRLSFCHLLITYFRKFLDVVPHCVRHYHSFLTEKLIKYYEFQTSSYLSLIKQS